jgi:hypothetical protein
MTAARAAAMGSTASEGARALWTLILVLGGAAAALATLDAMPTWLHGQPRGVRKAATIEEAERRIQGRVLLPAYFPDTLRWPPSTVRFTRDDGGAVALSFDARDGTPALLLVETVAGAAPSIPDGLKGRLAVIQQQSAPLGDGAILSRVVAEDGTLWSQFEWGRDGRHFLLRGRGSLEDLIRMARSIHGEGR